MRYHRRNRAAEGASSKGEYHMAKPIRDTGGPRHVAIIMGEGEPAHNLDNVMRAVETMIHGHGLHIGHNKITVSTSGLVPEIRRLARECKANLAVSLHATNDELRSWLMPINRKYPLQELMQVLRDEFPRGGDEASNAARQHKVFFQYVMLKGVNDSDEDAHRLVELIKGIPAKINLIPFNEWPGAPYERSSGNRIKAFADIVHNAGYSSPVRKPRGEDIMAACGQLKSETERGRKSRKEIAEEAAIR